MGRPAGLGASVTNQSSEDGGRGLKRPGPSATGCGSRLRNCPLCRVRVVARRCPAALPRGLRGALRRPIRSSRSRYEHGVHGGGVLLLPLRGLHCGAAPWAVHTRRLLGPSTTGPASRASAAAAAALRGPTLIPIRETEQPGSGLKRQGALPGHAGEIQPFSTVSFVFTTPYIASFRHAGQTCVAGISPHVALGDAAP